MSVERLIRLSKKSLNILKYEGLYGLTRRVQHRIQRRFNVPDRYVKWIEQYEPKQKDLEDQLSRSAKFSYQPLISIIIPVYNPPLSILKDTLDSALNQTYRNFEVCVSNGGGDIACRSYLDNLAKHESRIQLIHSEGTDGISENTNAALGVAHGEFVALLDHDDILAPFALYAIVEALNENSDIDIIYSDEDKLTPDGKRVSPFMKPDWSPELLHSFMYVGHLTVYRKKLIDKLGGFRSEFDGSQDYDLMLRATEATKNIYHVRQVLYHWRILPGSTSGDSTAKPYARKANLAALNESMHQRGYRGETIEYPFSNRFRFELGTHSLVSIIIPSDNWDTVSECIRNLYKVTGYSNFEVIVVTNSLLAQIIEQNCHFATLKCVRFDEPFNFSLKCNIGAVKANGDYLLFLNDDVQPLSSDWIETLLEYAQQPDIGGVSPKLLYSNNTIQYAGMISGVRDLVGTSFHTFKRFDSTYNSMVSTPRNISILCGACLILRTEVFRQVGGWDADNAPIANSDVDLSFKLLEKGFRLVYQPFAEMRHIGHQSIGKVEHGPKLNDESHLYLLSRWGKYISEDPLFPRNMRDILYHDESNFQIIVSNNEPNNWPYNKKVLLISHELTLSGAPIIVFEIAKLLKEAGWFVTVVAPATGKLVEGYKAESIPIIIDEYILTNPFMSRHFLGPYDLIVSNTVLGWHVVHAAKSIDKPCVWFIHEPEFGVRFLQTQSPNARQSFSLADVVVYPAQNTIELYKHYATVTHPVAIHYGISDMAPNIYNNLDKTLTRRIKIICVGSIERRKNAEVLIESIKRLTNSGYTNIEARFVGRFHEPDYVEKLKKAARELPNVLFIGELSRIDVMKAMSEADILVSTSREETGPIVVFEAMALGKAVISTRVGAASEIIIDGVNGYLIDTDDTITLTNHLKKLIDSPDQILELGRAARKTYEKHLTLRRYGEEILSLFEKVIEGNLIAKN